MNILTRIPPCTGGSCSGTRGPFPPALRTVSYVSATGNLAAARRRSSLAIGDAGRWAEVARWKVRESDSEDEGYQWWIRVIAVPLAVSLIAGGSAIWAARPAVDPAAGCSRQ